MRVKIFYIKELHQDLCQKIVKELRKIIDKDIVIESNVIPLDYNVNSEYSFHKIMDLFIRLFRNSMIKMNDFYVTLMNNSGNWCYIGGEYNKYSSCYSHGINLLDNQLKSIFPAVAIMNRVVLLPINVNEFFKGVGENELLYLFKPINLQGLDLINYENETMLSDSIKKIKEQLDAEIHDYCLRYLEIKNSRLPDYNVLEQLLDVDKQYLENIIKRRLSHNDKIEISSYCKDVVFMNKKSEINITFTNISDNIKLEEVIVIIKAPYGVIINNLEEGNQTYTLDFSSQKNINIKLMIYPQIYPFCPFEIQYKFPSYYANPMPFPQPLLLDVRRSQ